MCTNLQGFRGGQLYLHKTAFTWEGIIWYHIPVLALYKPQAFIASMQFVLQYYLLLVYNISTGPHLETLTLLIIITNNSSNVIKSWKFVCNCVLPVKFWNKRKKGNVMIGRCLICSSPCKHPRENVTFVSVLQVQVTLSLTLYFKHSAEGRESLLWCYFSTITISRITWFCNVKHWLCSLQKG